MTDLPPPFPSISSPPTPDERAAEQFWFRRFQTVLGVAHGAGLVFIGTYLKDAKDFGATARIALWPLTWFSLGGAAILISSLFMYLFTGLRLERIMYWHNERTEWRRRNKRHWDIDLLDVLVAIMVLAVVLFGIPLISFSCFALYKAVESILESVAQAACSQHPGVGICKNIELPN